MALLLTMLLMAVSGRLARGHDIYEEWTRRWGCACSASDRACEPVEVMTFPTTPDAYWLPKLQEWFPRRLAMPSPDERFHRCTYPLNMQWQGRGNKQGPEAWVEVPNNSTVDGKPKTLCLFVPNLSY